ncbi:MAG TPA: hypothetical protein VIX11_00970 [Candidatus Acidoferrum sp.]
MVDAPHHRCQPVQAVKAPPAIARVDRLAQRPGFKEIRLLEVACVRRTPSDLARANRANLLGKHTVTT